MPMKIKIPTKSTYFKTEAISTVDMFNAAVSVPRFAGFLLGCDIFDENFSTKRPLFIFSFGNLTFFLLLHFYDLFLYRNDILRCCFLLVTIGVWGQGMIKLYTFVYYRPKMVELKDRALTFLMNFNTKESKNIFEFWILIICHVELIAVILFPFCSFMAFIYPAIFYIFKSEWILHFGFELPMLDWENNAFGYLANWIYVGYLTFLFASATIASSSVSACYVFISFGQFDILKMLLDELDDLVIRNEKGANDVAIKKYITLITQQHYELIE